MQRNYLHQKIFQKFHLQSGNMIQVDLTYNNITVFVLKKYSMRGQMNMKEIHG